MKNNTIENYLESARNNEWTVTEEEVGENYTIYNFEKYSPAGQDFSFMAQAEGNDIDNLRDNILAYYNDYDVSSEAYMWLDENGHGKNGAPYDMTDVYRDMQDCQEMIYDLYVELGGEN